MSDDDDHTQRRAELRRHKKGLLVTLIGVALAGVVGPILVAQGDFREGRVVVDPPPGWVSLAAFRSPQEIVYVDRSRDQLMGLSLGRGHSAAPQALSARTGSMSAELEALLSDPDVEPVSIRRVAGGELCLQVTHWNRPERPRELVFLSDNLEVRTRQTLPTTIGDGWKLTGLWNWTSLREGTYLMYVDLAKAGVGGAEPQTASGFALVEGDHSEVLFFVGGRSSVHKYLVENRDYLVSYDGAGFILLPDRGAADYREGSVSLPWSGSGKTGTGVVRVNVGAQGRASLSFFGLAPELGSLPSLEALHNVMGFRSTFDYLQLLERRRTPVGLVVHNGLHVLAKSPLRGGSSEHSLVEIDVRTGKQVRVRTLGSKSAHVTVVSSGGAGIGIFEKRRVELLTNPDAPWVKTTSVMLARLP